MELMQPVQMEVYSAYGKKQGTTTFDGEEGSVLRPCFVIIVASQPAGRCFTNLGYALLYTE